MAAASLGLLLASWLAAPHAQQAQARVEIDNDDIGGVVTGPNGPEAGVWVIAETRDLGVRYIKSVVTDDRGRYVVPDLPAANYSVWARGYGLIDSDKASSRPGRTVNIPAKPAPTPAAAAHYYPAIYWYSMVKIPEPHELPKPVTQNLEGGAVQAAAPQMTVPRYLFSLKSASCVGCHQLGQLSTRTLPKELGTFASHEEAWLRRIQSGQSGLQMTGSLSALGPVGVRNFGDWTQRIEKGELPFATPQRPQGLERNIVVTLRDWMDEKHYLHDLIASDRRYPTVNGYGPVYGSPEYSSDLMPILDPVKNVATTFRLPVRDENTPFALGPGHAAGLDPLKPSPYWGNERIWDTKANNHNAMFDRDGRVWLAAAFRGADNPAFCKAGSDHPSAKLFPIERTNRQTAVFDPKTQKYTFVDICFGTHHLQFGYDPNDTLYFSGGGPVLGWVKTKQFLQTGDAQAAQGWTAYVVDTNANGKRDAYVEPNAPLDPAKDKRLANGIYAVMPSAVDSSIWGTNFGYPGGVSRIIPGANPPDTAITEYFAVPANSGAFGPRGGDIDRNGVVWASMASGHLGAFDRRKCKGPVNGPKAATGEVCPEGWSFYRYPGPGFRGIGENSAESSYYTWVDQHNTLGLGENVPISTGNLNDGYIAFKDGTMITIRIPYPMGWFAKGLDGRIDDPTGGWKARGLWSSNGDRTPWLIEGGKGTKPFAAHIQVRPNPLAH